jgi:hypothetical protein
MHNDRVIEFNLYKQILSHTKFWFRREVERYDFHPIVFKILTHGIQPDNMARLVAEWPHYSVNDPQNLAYTQNERNGDNDRQTVTTFGRYVRRHFSKLEDHLIRDYSSMCVSDNFSISFELNDIIRSVQEGPKSCMTWDSSYSPGNSRAHEHPYNVYNPKYGWGTALRINPETNIIMGRAIVNKESKTFVRTYKRGIDYSYADEALEFWLKQQGYDKAASWDDYTKLDRISKGRSFLCPYIDGENQRVTDREYCLVIDEDGDYEACNTDGYADGADNTRYCERCGCDHDEDDFFRVSDSYEEVCGSCYSDYVDAIGYAGRYETIHIDETVEVNGDNYAIDYLNENGVVELQNGDYAFEKDCIRDEYDGWHLESDVVDSDEVVVIDNVVYYKDSKSIFYCEGSSEYYLKSEVTPVEVDGMLYHPEYQPEKEENE